MRPLAIVVLVQALWGCASSPPRDRATLGSPSELAGVWEGSFLSPETGRSGTLRFVLTETGALASGQAVLTDDGLMRPDGRTAPPIEVGVESVTLEGGWVEGVLEPYRDPGCGCWLDTTFRGRPLSPGRLLGTYTSRADAGEVSHGAWTAERTDPSSRR